MPSVSSLFSRARRAIDNSALSGAARSVRRERLTYLSPRKLRRLESKLQAIARDTSVNFIASNDRLNTQAYKLNPPRIGMYKSYVASMDEGWTRFILENYDFSFTSILDKEIRAGNLRSKYDVIIIPGELSETEIIQGHRPGRIPPEFSGGIGEAGVENLREFLNGGGNIRPRSVFRG